jgi:DsbC/DsbD-like thiol-disulfide interchange protein
MKIVIAIITTLALTGPGVAAETDWVEVVPDVSVRLVSSDMLTDEGVIWMGLEIDMPADTKTYWRVPGETGLPLVVNTEGSRDIGGAEIAWPYPKREVAGGYLDHVFYGRVLFPLSVTVEGDAPVLVADITMGICSDICVPANVGLEIVPTLGAPDGPNDFRIRQALAAVPLPHDGEGILGAARFDMEAEAIIVDLLEPGFDHTSMIADIANSSLVFGEPEIVAPGRLSFALLGRAGPKNLGNANAHFTFNSDGGPFEIVRPLAGTDDRSR